MKTVRKKFDVTTVKKSDRLIYLEDKCNFSDVSDDDWFESLKKLTSEELKEINSLHSEYYKAIYDAEREFNREFYEESANVSKNIK